MISVLALELRTKVLTVECVGFSCPARKGPFEEAKKLSSNIDTTEIFISFDSNCCCFECDLPIFLG
jgi:hypothetical protein